MQIPTGLVVLSYALALGAAWAIYNLWSNLSSEKMTKQKLETEFANTRVLLQECTRNNEELSRLLKEKSRAMPWISELVADLMNARDERVAQLLETKERPALKVAEKLREQAKEKKRLQIEKRIAEYRLALIENLFPWLREIDFDDAEQRAEQDQSSHHEANDPASKWLSKDEWSTLSVSERYQRALDRYKRRSKSTWEVGREYERFIGYHWEAQGYDVIYHGALKGFDDFGRDLIVTGKSGKVGLIQCKLWSKHKTIPEAAIFQLLGSAVSFFIEKNGNPPKDFEALFSAVQPYIYSSTKVVPRIRDIAIAMGIKVYDDLDISDWPMIKCNIASDGERIYHLPMDQQYDRIKINRPGECYVSTIEEAEMKGFRRAKRWVETESGT